MSLADEQALKRVLKMIVEKRDQLGKAIDGSMDGVPAGFAAVDDQTFMTWFEQQVAASPPLPITDPDGFTRIVSPWVAMLPLTSNGNELLKRYERLMQRNAV